MVSDRAWGAEHRCQWHGYHNVHVRCTHPSKLLLQNTEQQGFLVSTRAALYEGGTRSPACSTLELGRAWNTCMTLHIPGDATTCARSSSVTISWPASYRLSFCVQAELLRPGASGGKGSVWAVSASEVANCRSWPWRRIRIYCRMTLVALARNTHSAHRVQCSRNTLVHIRPIFGILSDMSALTPHQW
jgi:hypothetical protein